MYWLVCMRLKWYLPAVESNVIPTRGRHNIMVIGYYVIWGMSRYVYAWKCSYLSAYNKHTSSPLVARGIYLLNEMSYHVNTHEHLLLRIHMSVQSTKPHDFAYHSVVSMIIRQTLQISENTTSKYCCQGYTKRSYNANYDYVDNRGVRSHFFFCMLA